MSELGALAAGTLDGWSFTCGYESLVYEPTVKKEDFPFGSNQVLKGLFAVGQRKKV